MARFYCHNALTTHFPTMYITMKEAAETINTKTRTKNSITFFLFRYTSYLFYNNIKFLQCVCRVVYVIITDEGSEVGLIIRSFI